MAGQEAHRRMIELHMMSRGDARRPTTGGLEPTSRLMHTAKLILV
jgi:hypothetical protein